MNKVFSTILIAGCLLLPALSFADAELNRCLTQNKAKANVYKICYGQKSSRAKEARKEDDAKRYKETKKAVQEKTIQLIQSVSQQKEQKPVYQTEKSVYQTAPSPTPAKAKHTPPAPVQQQQPVTQPQQTPAKPKPEPAVIQYY